MKKYAIITASFQTSAGTLTQLTANSGDTRNSYKTALLTMLNNAMQKMDTHEWTEAGLEFLVHYCSETKVVKAENYDQLADLVFSAEEDVSEKEIAMMQINLDGNKFFWRIAKLEV